MKVRSRCRNIIVLMLSISLIASCPSPPDPPDEIEDLPRVAYFGNLCCHPSGEWISVEHSDSVDTNSDGLSDHYFSGLWLIDVLTGEKSPFLEGLSDASWNPDGSKIALVSQGDIFTAEVTSTQTITLNTSTFNQLTVEGSNYSPDWSPCGNKIVYESNVSDTKFDIWIANIESEQNYNISLESDSADQGGWRNPDWSPLGGLIAHERYLTGGDIGTEIAVMDSAGGNPVYLSLNSEAQEFSPKFSPSGDYVGFLSRRYDGTSSRLCISSVEGHEWTILIEENVSSFDWSPDGRKVFFVYNAPENYPGSGELWVLDLDSGGRTQLTHNNS